MSDLDRVTDGEAIWLCTCTTTIRKQRTRHSRRSWREAPELRRRHWYWRQDRLAALTRQGHPPIYSVSRHAATRHRRDNLWNAKKPHISLTGSKACEWRIRHGFQIRNR